MKHTLTSLQAWLDDNANFQFKHFNEPWMRHARCFTYDGVRNSFVVGNGLEASIQQSSTHHCDWGSVEMWCCPRSPLLEPYGDGEDPYAHVPLSVVVDYLNELELRVVIANPD